MQAIDSCGKREKFVKFGNTFAVIKPICNDTQCQCFNFRNGFFSRFSVSHGTG